MFKKLKDLSTTHDTFTMMAVVSWVSYYYSAASLLFSYSSVLLPRKQIVAKLNGTKGKTYDVESCLF